MPRLKKILLRFLIALAVFLLLLVGAAVVMAPRIKGVVVEQVNKHLKTPISVDAIDFSFIRKFPYASVEFTGVKAQGQKTEGSRKPLLEAQHIFLLFNLYDVWGSDLKLKKIVIQDAQLHVYTDRKGNNNYDIFKSSDSKEQEHFGLEMDEVALEEVGISVVNRPADRDYDFRVHKGTLNGRFADDTYDLQLAGNLHVAKLKLGAVDYIHDKELRLESSLHMDTRQGLYEIRTCEVQLAELKLKASGNFSRRETGMLMNLEVSSNEADLGQLLSLLPSSAEKHNDKYTYDGIVTVAMRISGITSAKESPLITATFSARNATVTPNGTEYTLKNISFTGNYTNRASASNPVAVVSIRNLHANLQDQPLTASLEIENFEQPFIRLDLKSTINLAAFSRFYKPDTIESLNGNLLVDAHVSGHSDDRSSWISSGSIVAQDAAVKIRGRAVGFTNINGRFDLDGNKLTVTDFRTTAEGSDLTFNGTFDNIYGFLLSKDQVLHGSGSMSSRNIDLDELMEDHGKTTAGDTIYKLELSPRLDMNFRIQVGMITFRKFQAWQMQGIVSLEHQELKGSNLQFRAFQGNLQMDGSINAARPDSVLIAADVKTTRLDIRELFFQMGNFGQAVLVDKNVNGKMSASIQFASVWSKNLKCNFDRIYAKSDLTIENGELNDFKPMLVLSKYLKSSDLEHIRFSTLHNVIEVRNQTIFFPTMEIKSSALDLTASGTHTFDNIVDYKLQLYLSQLLGRKVKERNTEFGTIEDDGLGRTKIFLSMKGPLTSPTITWDRKAVTQNIKESIHQEKQTLKNILHDEFGWFKKDSTVTKPQPVKPKKEELEIDTEE